MIAVDGVGFAALCCCDCYGYQANRDGYEFTSIVYLSTSDLYYSTNGADAAGDDTNADNGEARGADAEEHMFGAGTPWCACLAAQPLPCVAVHLHLVAIIRFVKQFF